MLSRACSPWLGAERGRVGRTGSGLGQPRVPWTAIEQRGPPGALEARDLLAPPAGWPRWRAPGRQPRGVEVLRDRTQSAQGLTHRLHTRHDHPSLAPARPRPMSYSCDQCSKRKTRTKHPPIADPPFSNPDHHGSDSGSGGGALRARKMGAPRTLTHGGRNHARVSHQEPLECSAARWLARLLGEGHGGGPRVDPDASGAAAHCVRAGAHAVVG